MPKKNETIAFKVTVKIHHENPKSRIEAIKCAKEMIALRTSISCSGASNYGAEIKRAVLIRE